MRKLLDNSTVRRQDRTLDEPRAMELLRSAEYGVMSMIDREGQPYAVPINFVYDGLESIYLHCAPEGRKLDALREQSAVMFIIVGQTYVLSSKFTTEYESVAIRGEAHTGLPEEERRRALKLFIEKYSPEDVEIGLKYAEKSFHRTEIIRIDISTLTAKAKRVKGL